MSPLTHRYNKKDGSPFVFHLVSLPDVTLYCQMVRKQDTVEIPTVNETSTFDVLLGNSRQRR